MMNTVRLTEQGGTINALALSLIPVAQPVASEEKCVIEVHTAGVNPSDVNAALGFMPHAIWPRTPGRDYSGTVVDGPKRLLGKHVWGSGGELGIRRDGTHARFLVVDSHGVREKPESVSMLEAGAIGVPFITAYEGLRRAGFPSQDDVVLVLGANGKVGQATIQLATCAGARVFAVERTKEKYRGYASGPVDMIDASSTNIADYVRDKTAGRGADIVYNTVGSPYFQQANRAMALGGRQIFISPIDRTVPLDIFEFYRGQHTFVGIDTLALDSAACAAILDELAPGFKDGSFKAFPVDKDSVFELRDAMQAYRAVLAGARERVVLRP